jgi:hypothetical protein
MSVVSPSSNRDAAITVHPLLSHQPAHVLYSVSRVILTNPPLSPPLPRAHYHQRRHHHDHCHHAANLSPTDVDFRDILGAQMLEDEQAIQALVMRKHPSVLSIAQLRCLSSLIHFPLCHGVRFVF